MPHTKQAGSAVSLPPMEPFQAALVAMLPLADALAERVIDTLALGCDPFTAEDAQNCLYHHLMQTTHKRDFGDDDDADYGNRMSAGNDAALMIGFALGRRIGSPR